MQSGAAAQIGQQCSVTSATSEVDFQHHTSSLPPTTLIVIYFHAAWAEPCKQMSNVISTLASTYQVTSPPKISFISLDAEEVSDVSEAYNVTQVPFVALQKDGKVLETVSGSDAVRVREAVEKHAGAGDAGQAKSGIPPLQQVDRNAAGERSGNAASNDTKSLAGYAPTATDPATAPEYSSGENQQASTEELNARLSELVKAAPVMLFMKGTPSAPQCGFSRQTVSILRQKSIRYGFFNILADDEVRQGLKEYSDWPTFPQIYAGGELIGGLDILKEEFENDPEFLKEYIVAK